MISVIKGRPMGNSFSKSLISKVYEVIDFENIKSEGIHMVGSHMMGTDNKYSDMDIRLYYAYYLGEILNVIPPTLSLTDKGRECMDKANNMFMIKGKSYDITATPILSRRIALKPNNELSMQLLTHNTHSLLHLIMGEQLMANTRFDGLIEDVLSKYVWDKNKILHFTRGICDAHYNRSIGMIHQHKEISQLYKNILLEVYYGLNGISLLKNEVVYGQLNSLVMEFADMFAEDTFRFLEETMALKKGYKKVETNQLKSWMDNASLHIADIHSLINKEVDVAVSETPLTTMDGVSRQNNVDIINEYLFAIYEQEVEQ